MTATRYLGAARTAASVIIDTLMRRGLEPHISRFVLVETKHGTAWLFAVVDVHKIQKMEPYLSWELQHQISTTLRGLPVRLSNSNGLRYGVLLSNPPSLPKSIDFPGWRSGLVQVGQGINGTEAVTTWDNLGHVLVAGMTGMGKSYFLRLLVAQAIQEGHALALADPDGRTFPKLAGHPALFTQLGQTLEGSEQVVNLVDQELRRRIALFGEAENAPDNLEDYNKEAKVKLPRLLVIVDEFNGLVMATGGPKAALAQAVTQIAWRGRKFGVNLILAGQDFTKDIVGPSREMLTTRICFRVASDDTSRIVLNRSGAENLKNPGRALTNAWGLIQTYRAEITALPQGDGLSKEERALAEVLIRDFQGRMSYGALMGMGFSRSRADRIRQDWLTRGLAEVHPDEDNALCVRMSRFSLQTGLPPQAPQTPQTEKGAEQDAE